MGTPEVRLLLPHEIEAMRADVERSPYDDVALMVTEDGRQRWRASRIVYTLGYFWEAAAERDTWKAEAEDRRAEVERLREALTLTTEDRDHFERTYDDLQERLEDEITERNRLRGERDRLVRDAAFYQRKLMKLIGRDGSDGGTGLPGEAVGGD